MALANAKATSSQPGWNCLKEGRLATVVCIADTGKELPQGYGSPQVISRIASQKTLRVTMSLPT